MLDLRSPLILAAAPAGLALGAAVWLLLAGGSASAEMTALDARLASARASLAPRSGADAAAQAAILPLFPTDAASQKEAVVRLQGLSRTPRRQAALVSIDGKPAQWIERGQSLDGVTLVAVLSAKAVIETADGRKEIGFWDKLADPTATAPVDAGANDLPPGAKLPPPPASAPGP